MSNKNEEIPELLDIGLGNDFLNPTPKVKATTAKIIKWHYVPQTKKLLYSKANQ